MPSVTTSELILRNTVSTPLTAPMKAESSRLIATATQTFMPLPTSDPITTEVTAITLPIEMSISPAMISIVSVTAMIPRMLTTAAAVNRLSTVMKYCDCHHMRPITAARISSSPWPCRRSAKCRRRSSCCLRLRPPPDSLPVTISAATVGSAI